MRTETVPTRAGGGVSGAAAVPGCSQFPLADPPAAPGGLMPAVQITAVSKTYRRCGRPPQKALDGLHLLVEAGGVQAFLGPNGSGKRATIRVLLGLVRPDAGGDIRLLDQPVPAGLPSVIGGVGALVETPLFFPGFSGRLNLRLLAESAGVPRSRVEECLELVDLRDRADDK